MKVTKAQLDAVKDYVKNLKVSQVTKIVILKNGKRVSVDEWNMEGLITGKIQIILEGKKDEAS